MKKINAKYMLAGGLAVSSSLLLGCFHQPVPLYGPPPDTSFTPEINIPEGVYGPPSDYELGLDFDEEDTTPAPSFDPADNLPAPVYGPPAGF